MTESYTVPTTFNMFLSRCLHRIEDDLAFLEHQKHCLDISYYAVNIPIILVGSLSVFLPAIVPTLMSAVQGVYTFFNVVEKRSEIDKAIHSLNVLRAYLHQEQLFNVESKIGRYVNDSNQIVEIKTDDDFELYILHIEKRVNDVLNAVEL